MVMEVQVVQEEEEEVLTHIRHTQLSTILMPMATDSQELIPIGTQTQEVSMDPQGIAVMMAMHKYSQAKMEKMDAMSSS